MATTDRSLGEFFVDDTSRGHVRRVDKRDCIAERLLTEDRARPRADHRPVDWLSRRLISRADSRSGTVQHTNHIFMFQYSNNNFILRCLFTNNYIYKCLCLSIKVCLQTKQTNFCLQTNLPMRDITMIVYELIEQCMRVNKTYKVCFQI